MDTEWNDYGQVRSSHHLSTSLTSISLTSAQVYSKALDSQLGPYQDVNPKAGKYAEDWMSLDGLAWPESPFSQSSLSSTGGSYSLQGSPWSPFEGSCTTATQALVQCNGLLDTQDTSYLNSPANAQSINANQTAFEIDWFPEDPRPVFPWVDLSSASKGGRTNEERAKENIMSVPSPISSPSPTSLTETPTPTTPESTCRSSELATPPKPTRISKRVKKDADARIPKRTRHTSAKPKPKPNRKPRSPSLASINSSVSQDSRNSHNLIEKQYRNRLNSQFESLLETLPHKEPTGEAGEKRLSKAEVLVHANQYIQELEEEMRILEEKNDELEECLEGWKARYSRLGDRDSSSSGSES